ncbi:hypothetical protein C8R46DRAFT_1067850 [Mycena filopes]|nr:hypothetical protein C8R46DRAFT_1067850 [Mycena filopes]
MRNGSTHDAYHPRTTQGLTCTWARRPCVTTTRHRRRLRPSATASSTGRPRATCSIHHRARYYRGGNAHALLPTDDIRATPAHSTHDSSRALTQQVARASDGHIHALSLTTSSTVDAAPPPDSILQGTRNDKVPRAPPSTAIYTSLDERQTHLPRQDDGPPQAARSFTLPRKQEGGDTPSDAESPWPDAARSALRLERRIHYAYTWLCSRCRRSSGASETIRNRCWRTMSVGVTRVTVAASSEPEVPGYRPFKPTRNPVDSGLGVGNQANDKLIFLWALGGSTREMEGLGCRTTLFWATASEG